MSTRRDFLKQASAVATLPALPLEALSELKTLNARLAAMHPTHRLYQGLQNLYEIHRELGEFVSDNKKSLKLTAKQDVSSEYARLCLAKEFINALFKHQDRPYHQQQSAIAFSETLLLQKIIETDLIFKSTTLAERLDFIDIESIEEDKCGSSFPAGFQSCEYIFNLSIKHGRIKAAEIAFAAAEKQRISYASAAKKIKNEFHALADKLSDRTSGISPHLVSWLRLAGNGESQKLFDHPSLKTFSNTLLALVKLGSSLEIHSSNLNRSTKNKSGGAKNHKYNQNIDFILEWNDTNPDLYFSLDGTELINPDRDFSLDGTELINPDSDANSSDLLADPLLRKLHAKNNPRLGLLVEISSKLSEIDKYTQELESLGIARNDLVLLETPINYHQQVSAFLKAINAVQYFIENAQPGNPLPQYLARNLAEKLAITEATITNLETGEWDTHELLRIEMIRAHRYLASGIF